MTKAQEKKWIESWKEHNKHLKQNHRHKEMLSFSDYVSDVIYGKNKVTLKEMGKKTYVPSRPYRREFSKGSSVIGTGKVELGRKESSQYTGGKLLGIATMHKSNMVPVFKKQDAEDISKMRRN